MVELAEASVNYAFAEKRDVFEAAGVGKYLVFETIEGRIEWWRHHEVRLMDPLLRCGERDPLGFTRMVLDGTDRETIRLAVYDRFDHGFAAVNGFVLGKYRKVTADLPQFVSLPATMHPQLNFG
tara:strand:+ start:363 stop:734 length:372 start_codon:yes stop_codon:yes gene_type:complete